MSVEQRLRGEAAIRAATLAGRFQTGRCVGCNTAGVGSLTSVRFRWRNQVGKDPPLVVEHTTEHPLCTPCLEVLRTRRRLWWPVRLAFGVTMAAFCGLIACPVILLSMRLHPAERNEVFAYFVLSTVAAIVAVFAGRVTRALSVPAALTDMVGRGWECWDVTPA